MGATCLLVGIIFRNEAPGRVLLIEILGHIIYLSVPCLGLSWMVQSGRKALVTLMRTFGRSCSQLLPWDITFRYEVLGTNRNKLNIDFIYKL